MDRQNPKTQDFYAVGFLSLKYEDSASPVAQHAFPAEKIALKLTRAGQSYTHLDEGNFLLTIGGYPPQRYNHWVLQRLSVIGIAPLVQFQRKKEKALKNGFFAVFKVSKVDFRDKRIKKPR